MTSDFARQVAEIELGLREPVLRVGNLEAARDFTDVRDVGEALDRAVAYRNEERKRRGKRFRDTVRKDRRRLSKVPVWLRTTKPDQA